MDLILIFSTYTSKTHKKRGKLKKKKKTKQCLYELHKNASEFEQVYIFKIHLL